MWTQKIKQTHPTPWCILIGISLLSLAWSCRSDEKSIPKDMAESIASERAAELDYQVDDKTAEIIKYTTDTNKCLPPASELTIGDEGIEKWIETEIRAKLGDKEYWLIYYKPMNPGENEAVLDDELCIFIDAQTGDILTEMRW